MVDVLLVLKFRWQKSRKVVSFAMEAAAIWKILRYASS